MKCETKGKLLLTIGLLLIVLPALFVSAMYQTSIWTVSDDWTISNDWTLSGDTTLTIEATGGGTVDPAVGSHSYALFTNVTLTAIASSGYTCTAWEINGVNYTASTTWAVMNSSVTAKAYFTATKIVCGVSWSSISKINGVSVSVIAKVNRVE